VTGLNDSSDKDASIIR